ncbi:MAG: NAD(P)/FAD-dependent oxidoreductase [Terrimicrobiaceae bacterium]|nr:NAD(P)/FAD-dependent oxidoreductase [Terrimicrobiaceae bacterium]
MNDERFDVAVLGGGPAGSTAAAILARRGRRVVVFERERFPRFHIGESLLPRSMSALERSGVLPKIEAAGFVRKFGAEICSGCGTRESRFYFKDGFRPESETAFQVTRAEFDKILLDHAESCGADVRQETAVESVDFDAGEAAVRFQGPGDHGEVRARFVLDCTGRHALMGTQKGLKQRYEGLDKIAVYAHYHGVPRPDGIDGTLTRMVRAADRWFWMIPLADDRMSVGVVADTAVFRESRLAAEEFLTRSIQSLPVMQERLATARMVTKVYVSGDYSYRSSELFGERWLSAGDAAGFIDPVFSSGVFLAILGAEQAAEALDEALTHPDRARTAFSRHARRLEKVMGLYLRFVRAWYRQEFIETVLNPREFFGIVPAVNAVLAGNTGAEFALRWRLALFQLIVTIQRFVPLCPRLALQPSLR